MSPYGFALESNKKNSKDNSETDGSFAYPSINGGGYRIPKNRIETVASLLAELGIISAQEKQGLLIFNEKGEVVGLKNLAYSRLNDLEKQVSALKKLKITHKNPAWGHLIKRWDDVMESGDFDITRISPGASNEVSESAAAMDYSSAGTNSTGGTGGNPVPYRDSTNNQQNTGVTDSLDEGKKQFEFELK
jgi:hypothetical protein